MFDYNSQRNVHLDFHTPDFVKVGEKFNAKEFGDTLEKAAVNSIAVFAHCHHGYTYYPSKVGVTHPGLQCDLLGGITEELKKRGIQCIIYFSQNVNETLSAVRPECAALKADGTPMNSQILLSGEELYWTWLCPNRGDWVDSLFLPLVKETISNYYADGIFVDMAGYLPGSCYCESCRDGMKKAGLDINNPAEHSDFLVKTNQDVAVKLRKLLDSVRPGMRFLEGSFSRLGDAHLAKGVLSEFYLETLPVQTGWFIFPLLARYFRNIGLPVMGLTGRFLNNWGDFGTVKTSHQLKIEVSTHLAAGLPSGVGDHMHFNGKLEKPVYKVIGDAFRFLEKRQPYCVGGEPLCEVVIPLPKRFSAVAAVIAKNGKTTYDPMTALTGLSKTLTELHYQWDISNDETDYEKYGAVLLNHDTCEMQTVDKIMRFVENGGLLIACHDGLKASGPEATAKWQKFLGVKSMELLPDPGIYYQVKSKLLRKDIPDMPIYTHTRSYKVEFESDVEAVADLVLAPCIRSKEKFYGHFHGASDKKAGTAIGIRKIGKGIAVIVAPSLFYSYMMTGNPHHFTLVRNIMQAFFSEDKRKLKSNAPGVVELALSMKDGKIIFQAVPFIVGRKHRDTFETLNEPVSVSGITVWIKSPFENPSVIDPVKNKELRFKKEGEYIKLRLPPIKEHFLAAIGNMH
ncbi:MAG: alpha-L-fucosidase [Lentisphaerae bacterium]|nr:alpha-L-fucosidase [Lentisphaerota bacterium]